MKQSRANNNICPECGSGQLMEKNGVYETSLFDDDETKPLRVGNMKWLECEKCGEVVLDDPAMDQIERVRYKELGLLSPRDIKEIRSSLGKTQEEMATLLAVGQKTYCRWENGNFYQTRHNDRVLRFIRRMQLECPEALRILEEISGSPTSARLAMRSRSEPVPPNWFGPSLCDHAARPIKQGANKYNRQLVSN